MEVPRSLRKVGKGVVVTSAGLAAVAGVTIAAKGYHAAVEHWATYSDEQAMANLCYNGTADEDSSLCIEATASINPSESDLYQTAIDNYYYAVAGVLVVSSTGIAIHLLRE